MEALQVVKRGELSEETSAIIDKEIDRIISRHKNNRYEINRLVFQSMTALTTSENYSDELHSQGFLKRLWGGITGQNRELQNRIDRSLAAAQYASQQTLQKLAEQNLMSFELITAVNNKLNSSLVQIEDKINTIYGTLVTFFKQTKSDIIQLEQRIERLEKNVNLLNWQNSIEYQMFEGVEYEELDPISKIICLTRDFYDLTAGRWTTSDLLLLKSAMSSIGISPKELVNYKNFICAVSSNESLMTKLFGGMDVGEIEKYLEYIVITAGIKKRYLLDTTEKMLVNSTMELISQYSDEVTESEIGDNLLDIYVRDQAKIKIDSFVNSYDMILELLYNLEQIREIEKIQKAERKLNEAEALFGIYDTDNLIPLLEELIQHGITKAKYIMALLFETGCKSLKRDDEKCDVLLDECIEEGYLPAIVRKYLPLNRNSNLEFCKEEFPRILHNLEKMAKDGDKFASYECARIYINWKWAGLGNEQSDREYKKAIEYFEASPYVLGLYGKARRYDEGQGVKKDHAKAFELYLIAANLGYNRAQYEVGRDYQNGWGVEKNPKLAFEYYEKAYKNGSRDAICQCGWCLSNEFGTNNDYKRAFELFTEGAELNEIACIDNLGWHYHWGYYVNKDMNKAKEYYQKAADMGSEYSKKRLKDYF